MVSKLSDGQWPTASPGSPDRLLCVSVDEQQVEVFAFLGCPRSDGNALASRD